jgi:hypothetical protein
MFADMFRARGPVPSLILALALAAASAGAAHAADDTAPIANPRADETAAQIDDWIREASAEPAAGAATPDRPVDRQMHGEVGFGIGTNGYRSAYGIVTMPIGKTGTATVALSENRMNFRGRRGTDRSLALSLAFGDAARSPAAGPRACDDGPPLGPFNHQVWRRPTDGLALACQGADPRFRAD